MREDDIRPDALRDLQQAAYARDIQRVLERRDEFVDVCCPGCGSSHRHHEFTKFSLAFQRCESCRMVYMSPRPSPSVLDYYYSTSENYKVWNERIFPASEEARRKNIFRPRAQRTLEICERCGVGRTTLIDVGAGFGTFLDEVRSEGAFEELIAVEPTPSLAETCRARGFRVLESNIELVEQRSLRADVVTAFEVIEHLFRPADFVRACAKFLRPGGLLILTCPNIDGFDLMVLREQSATIDLEHLNYFTPSSLSALLQTCGFSTVEASTPGLLDAELVRKAALRGEVDLDRQPFLRTLLVERWNEVGHPFQRFLSQAGLSSHLWLVGSLGSP